MSTIRGGDWVENGVENRDSNENENRDKNENENGND